MAGKVGRPKSTNPKPPTALIRVPPDLAAMLSEVCRLHGMTAAQLVDTILRKQIEARYEAIRPQLIELAKQSKEAKSRLEAVEAALKTAREYRASE